MACSACQKKMIKSPQPAKNQRPAVPLQRPAPLVPKSK